MQAPDVEFKELIGLAVEGQWSESCLERAKALLVRLREGPRTVTVEKKIEVPVPVEVYIEKPMDPAVRVLAQDLIGQVFDLSDPFARLASSRCFELIKARCPQITRKQLRGLLESQGFPKLKSTHCFLGIKEKGTLASTTTKPTVRKPRAKVPVSQAMQEFLHDP